MLGVVWFGLVWFISLIAHLIFKSTILDQSEEVKRFLVKKKDGKIFFLIHLIFYRTAGSHIKMPHFGTCRDLG